MFDKVHKKIVFYPCKWYWLMLIGRKTMLNKKRLLSATLAVITACTVLPSVNALACTTVLVGKKATVNGATIIARNEDVSTNNPKYVVTHEAKKNKIGEKFVSKANKFTMELPIDKCKYTSTPEWTDEYGVFEESGTNEYGVAMSATESTMYNKKIKKLDPLVKNGISEEAMVTVVLPYIKSAREGVKYLGDIVTKYGSAECNGIAFSDVNEIWYMEIVSGHHWVAQRIPDNKYAVIANQSSIREVDLKDTKNFMADDNLKNFVKKNKLVKKGKKLNIRNVFGTNSKEDKTYNIPRVWDGQRILTPSKKGKYDITSKKIPFLNKADKKVSVEDVRKVLSSHFNGTKYDTYKKAKDNFRPINVQRTVESHIIEWRQNMPVEISGIHYIALGTAEQSVYVPFYNGITSTIDEYRTGESDKPTDKSAYWIFKMTDVLSTPYYDAYMKKFVNPSHKKIYKALNKNIAESDKKAMEIYNKNKNDKRALSKYLTEETNKNCNYTLNKVKELNKKMITKSTDARSIKHNKNL